MSHHSKMDASKTQTGSIKSKTGSRRSGGESLKDIDDVKELEMNDEDSQQIQSVSKSKHSQSQVVQAQSSKKSSVAASLQDVQDIVKSSEHTRSKGLEEKAESSYKPSAQQSLKGIEGDASGTLNVNEKTSHHTQSLEKDIAQNLPPSPTGSVRYERKKTESKEGSRSRHDSPFKVSSPTHVKSSDDEAADVLAEKSKSI